jgi:hypothetical protein
MADPAQVIRALLTRAERAAAHWTSKRCASAQFPAISK